MPKFRFTQNEKITVRERTDFEVEAASEEEAVVFHDANQIAGLDRELGLGLPLGR